MVIVRKPLEFGVYWFLNYENRFSGSKVMTQKSKEFGNFLECPSFWPNIFNLVYFRQLLSKSLSYFFKYIPNWTKNYLKIFVFLFNASFWFWVKKRGYSKTKFCTDRPKNFYFGQKRPPSPIFFLFTGKLDPTPLI